MENKEKNFTKIKFTAILILLIIGIALCFDLSYIFYKANFLETFTKSFCTVSELIDCDGVAATTYSVSMGVPNAIWGLLLYFVMLMLLFVDKIQEKFKNTIFDVFENPSSYIATLGLLAFCISMLLAGISIFKIHKICYLCFCTYIINLLIALIARKKDFFITDIKTTVEDFVKGAKKYFALFIVVLIAFISTLIYLDNSMIASPKLKKEKAFKEFYEAKKNKYAVKGNVLGKENAKVAINVYSDYNCPYCRVLNIMLHKLSKEKDVIINEINFPLDSSCNPHIGMTLGGHENSCLYARYALAAKKQGKFWGAANTLFDTRPENEDLIIEQFKKAHLGLDIDKLKSDANSPSIQEELSSEIESAFLSRVFATPSISINGTMYEGVSPYDDLKERVNLAIKRTQN